MHVGHLLQLESLDLTLLWGEQHHLEREVSGVTATDLEDPARFLQQGELVLSGLVWWSPGAGRPKTDRFVSALRAAGATALLAGEETHGTVPDDVVESCREHGIAVFAVPAHTSFRAITEAVYLRQWGNLSRRPTPHYALPENVRTELSRLLDRGAGPDELLDRAFAHLGPLPCYLLTASGRTVARTPSAPALPVRRAAESLEAPSGVTLRVQAESSPYDAWHLHLPDVGQAPPRVLHEIADVIAQHRHSRSHDRGQGGTGGQREADLLISLIDAPSSHVATMDGALRACGLPAEGPYRVVVATRSSDKQHWAADALAEALHHFPASPFALSLRSGEAVAVLHTGPDGKRPALDELWPLLHACHPAPLHAGLSGPATAPDGLGAALVQARYALAAARSAAPDSARVTAVEDLDSLGSLLAGVPSDVRAAYSARTLGPLGTGDSASHSMLLETLEVFLAHNCSWARTAEALHLHVNTVHYRVERIEALTGRDLSRLDHKLDLRAALMCR
ncbi:helix-turn-helix domain-containing protein [Streptomyces sp. NPDC000410]|uniref:helix-turn-helix domain-containing protein n=1 Tax=Streptomyces sp. NPDC000410 TaxID=3154254 RepID=UPI0033324448